MSSLHNLDMHMTETADGEVRVEWHSHVAVTLIDRPPTNFVSTELLTCLADCWAALDDDPRCRALVLATQGRVFAPALTWQNHKGLQAGQVKVWQPSTNRH